MLNEDTGNCRQHRLSEDYLDVSSRGLQSGGLWQNLSPSLYAHLHNDPGKDWFNSKSTSILEAMDMPSEGPSFSATSVFYPDPQQAAKNLLNATVFTGINVLAAPAVVKAILEANPNLRNTFCLGHMCDVPIFDAVESEHTSHVRALLQVSTEREMKANIHRCAFNKPSWTETGLFIALAEMTS